MTWQASEWTFATERLRVIPWRDRGDQHLARFLSVALTDDVTRELPPSWQQGVNARQAAAWIEARDQEGPMFLVEDRRSSEPVGFFMFFPEAAEPGAPGLVRVGYVLAEAAWGKGYASELVAGFAGRWDERGITAELAAGVTRGNPASQRVLEKNGFVRIDESGDVLHYRRANPGAR